MRVLKKAVLAIISIIVIIAVIISVKDNLRIKEANGFAVCQKPKIVVDAGHGGFDGGAVKGETVEKDINLAFALEIEPIFKLFGYEVLMTRTGDCSTEDEGLSTIRQKKVSDIKNRLSLVENTDIECFLSLHQNMFSSPRFSGTQVFYSPNNEKSKSYAESIKASVDGFMNQESTREIKKCGSNIYLMYHSTKPSVLVECGFMSNEKELEKLLDTDYRGRLNLCIVTGILNERKQ